MSLVDLRKEGSLAKCCILSNKVWILLLDQLKLDRQNLNNYLNATEKAMLLRAKNLIIVKIMKAAKLCHGEEVDDISGLSEGIELYGYALPIMREIDQNINFSDNGIIKFIKKIDMAISFLIEKRDEKSHDNDMRESLLITKNFFKFFAENLCNPAY